MVISVADALSLPSGRRRSVLSRSDRGPYGPRVKRGPFTRQEMLSYIRERGEKSRDKFRLASDPSRPSVGDIVREFGSWTAAVRAAFDNSASEAAPTTAEYILRCVLDLGLWDTKSYLSARKSRPDIVPSLYRVLSEWGKFSNLFEMARQKNIERTLVELLKLKRKIGRIPSISDAKDNGIALDDAIKFFGSKQKLDGMIVDLEIQYERRTRS